MMKGGDEEEDEEKEFLQLLDDVRNRNYEHNVSPELFLPHSHQESGFSINMTFFHE